MHHGGAAAVAREGRQEWTDRSASRGRRVTLGLASVVTTLWLTSSTRARPARREAVSHLEAQDRWESYVELLDESSGSLYLTTQYAQCCECAQAN